MNKITEITLQKNKSRANIYLDGDFVCGMELSTIMKHSLKVGSEISSDKLLELQKDSDIEKATEKALKLLDRQLYTKKQIKDKLKLKGYGDETILAVVKKLENYGYINDSTYAKSYISSAKGKSKRELECALLTKGISRHVIMDVLENAQVDDMEAANILADKFMRYKEKTRENKEKLYAKLYRKGFSSTAINSAVNKWFSCDEQF